MTYFGVLVRFILTPIVILAAALWWQRRRGVPHPPQLGGYAPWLVLAAHVVVAVVYTTPWDNYLVATAVWWYDPDLVTGIVLGYVPIEEYTFFVVQSIMTGLWLLWLARTFPALLQAAPSRLHARGVILALGGALWLVMAGILAARWQPGTYLALELVWALPPILFQVWFGSAILWRYRRLLAAVLVPATLYLAVVDALAIASGTWTISPTQTLGIYLPGNLPLEEFVFFLVTNVLLAFGVTLVLAQASQARLAELRGRFGRIRQPIA